MAEAAVGWAPEEATNATEALSTTEADGEVALRGEGDKAMLRQGVIGRGTEGEDSRPEAQPKEGREERGHSSELALRAGTGAGRGRGEEGGGKGEGEATECSIRGNMLSSAEEGRGAGEGGEGGEGREGEERGKRGGEGGRERHRAHWGGRQVWYSRSHLG